MDGVASRVAAGQRMTGKKQTPSVHAAPPQQSDDTEHEAPAGAHSTSREPQVPSVQLPEQQSAAVEQAPPSAMQVALRCSAGRPRRPVRKFGCSIRPRSRRCRRSRYKSPRDSDRPCRCRRSTRRRRRRSRRRACRPGNAARLWIVARVVVAALAVCSAELAGGAAPPPSSGTICNRCRHRRRRGNNTPSSLHRLRPRVSTRRGWRSDRPGRARCSSRNPCCTPRLRCGTCRPANSGLLRRSDASSSRYSSCTPRQTAGTRPRARTPCRCSRQSSSRGAVPPAAFASDAGLACRRGLAAPAAALRAGRARFSNTRTRTRRRAAARGGARSASTAGSAAPGSAALPETRGARAAAARSSAIIVVLLRAARGCPQARR